MSCTGHVLSCNVMCWSCAGHVMSCDMQDVITLSCSTLPYTHTHTGDEVSFEHVYLPKGTFVRLQPVSSAWLVSVVNECV